MLQIIINAYEDINRSDSSFKAIKGMQIWLKILLGIMLLFWVTTFVFCTMGKFELAIIFVFAGITITYGSGFLMSKSIKKNWRQRIENYNQKLDYLKEILQKENINCYRKNAIEQLIEQCDETVKINTDEEEKKGKTRIEYMQIYILPILTFGLGKAGNVLGDEKVLYIVILLLLMIAIAFSGGKAINSINEWIFGDICQENRYMRGMLKDLLIRDFE